MVQIFRRISENSQLLVDYVLLDTRDAHHFFFSSTSMVSCLSLFGLKNIDLADKHMDVELFFASPYQQRRDSEAYAAAARINVVPQRSLTPRLLEHV